MKRYLPLFVLLLCGCAHNPRKLEGIPLVWKPTSTMADFGAIDMNGMADVKIQIEKFSDARKNLQLIGMNHEDAKARLVTTKDDAGDYVAGNMRDTMQKAGLDIVDTGGQIVIGGEISDFFVEEMTTYKSQITLHVSVRDSTGKVLWSGIIGGNATRFGHSFDAENYYEVLSDALMEAMHDLLVDPAFRAAVAAQK